MSGRRAVVGIALLVVIAITALSFGLHAYVMNQAKRDITTMLLQHKGVHQYVQRLAHPEMNELKNGGQIAPSMYSPALFSSTFMVRNMHAFYNEERQKAGLPQLYYKIAADNPRNPVNRADAREMALIERFNRDRTLRHVEEIIEEDGTEYLYVAVPFLENVPRCLACHGERAAAPPELQRRYPGEGGFNEQVGRIRAIESLKAPLEGDWTIPVIVLISTGLAGLLIVALSGMNRRLRQAVAERTATVTQQARTLRENENSLRITLGSIGDGVVAVDMDGVITRINKEACRLVGWDASAAVGRPVTEVFKREGATADFGIADITARIISGETDVGESRSGFLRAADGRLSRIAERATPILDDSGRTVGAVLVVRDVTAQHELEMRLRQSEKMDAVGLLAGGVAHDFNNMLTGIYSAAEFLQEDLAADDPAQHHVAALLGFAERAAELTAGLLTFSRRSDSTFATVDVHQALRETVLLLRHTLDKRVSVTPALEAERSCVHGNLSLLESIFINLGINAGLAMPDGGILTFATRNVSDVGGGPESQQSEWVEIVVSDTGSGIAPEDLSRIFEPFFTTRPVGQGTGLGLSAAYGAVQSHNGTITVESELNRGTVFTIRLPLESEPCCAPASKAAARSIGGTVLVVDDEPKLRKMAARMLERDGYTVLTAADGVEAVNVFRENASIIDAVLLDMVMPRMSGADCFDALREIRPDAVIIVVSGYTEGRDLARLRASGLNAFLSKPFERSALLELLSETIKAG